MLQLCARVRVCVCVEQLQTHMDAVAAAAALLTSHLHHTSLHSGGATACC